MKKQFKFLIGFISLFLLTTPSYAQTQLSTDIQVPESAVIAAPTATPNADGGGANCTAGNHNFAVSFVTTVSGVSYETGIGNGSAAALCDGTHTKVDVSVIPVGSFNVTARNIYATRAGTTAPFYLVSNNSIADNSTTTFSFNVSDANLTVPLVPKATPAAASLWRFLSNGNVIPLNDNTQLFGDSTHRINKINALVLPTFAGGVPTAIDCGSTGAGNQTCTPTTTTALTKIIAGHSTLASNAAVITLPSSSAFTGTATYDCVGNDVTTRANPVQVVQTSASTFTITNTTGASDVIEWICVGN